MCRCMVHLRLNILHQSSYETIFFFASIQGCFKGDNLSLNLFAFTCDECHELVTYADFKIVFILTLGSAKSKFSLLVISVFVLNIW